MNTTRQTRDALGIGGWAYAGNYRLERYLYFAHRITGLSLLLTFLVYLVRITFLQIQGQDTWAATFLMVHNRWFGVVTSLFIFHAMNGLRLGLQETGLLLGRPGPPSYPYVDAIRRYRLLNFILLAAAFILITAVLILFFVIGVP